LKHLNKKREAGFDASLIYSQMNNAKFINGYFELFISGYITQGQ